MSAPMTWRDVQRLLSQLGASPVRTTGSHEHWRFPDGEMFVVIRNHLSDSVPKWVLAKLRSVRERRRAPRGDEPLLLGLTGPRWSLLA